MTILRRSALQARLGLLDMRTARYTRWAATGRYGGEFHSVEDMTRFWNEQAACAQTAWEALAAAIREVEAQQAAGELEC